jgi:uncharacterized membrane protein
MRKKRDVERKKTERKKREREQKQILYNKLIHYIIIYFTFSMIIFIFHITAVSHSDTTIVETIESSSRCSLL